jgi:excisionase family DNA binding protein
MTALEAAALLRLAYSVLLLHTRRGTIPGRKVGRHWRYSRAALIAWLSTPSARVEPMT